MKAKVAAYDIGACRNIAGPAIGVPSMTDKVRAWKCAEAKRQLEQQIPYSTDPEWVRRQMDEPQFSPAFIIVGSLVGALAFYGVFMAIASI